MEVCPPIQPDPSLVMDGSLKLCEVFVVTLALCHTDPHVGGVKQTQIMIFYWPERYQASSLGIAGMKIPTQVVHT